MRSPPSSYYDDGYKFETLHPHFLDSCFFCNRALNHNTDIFMYRGDTPFCSQECRQEQIEIDEASEKRSWEVSISSMKRSRAAAAGGGRQSSNTDGGKKAVRTGTVAVS